MAERDRLRLLQTCMIVLTLTVSKWSVECFEASLPGHNEKVRVERLVVFGTDAAGGRWRVSEPPEPVNGDGARTRRALEIGSAQFVSVRLSGFSSGKGAMAYATGLLGVISPGQASVALG